VKTPAVIAALLIDETMNILRSLSLFSDDYEDAEEDPYFS